MKHGRAVFYYRIFVGIINVRFVGSLELIYDGGNSYKIFY